MKLLPYVFLCAACAACAACATVQHASPDSATVRFDPQFSSSESIQKAGDEACAALLKRAVLETTAPVNPALPAAMVMHNAYFRCE